MSVSTRDIARAALSVVVLFGLIIALFFVLALLAPTDARAQAPAVRFHFMFPDSYEDDAPLDRSAIQQSLINCGTTPAGEPVDGARYPVAFQAEGAPDFIDAPLAVGTWFCVGRIRANDMVSRFSNELEVIITPAGPGEGVRPRAVTIFFQ